MTMSKPEPPLSEDETKRVLKALRVRRALDPRSVNAIAKASKVPQPTLDRLLKARPRRISRRTFRSLGFVYPDVDWVGMVLSSGALNSLKSWERWVAGLNNMPGVQLHLRRLPAHSKAVKAIQGFRSWAKDRGHSLGRINASVNGVIMRLYPQAYARGAGIERELEDLTARELDQFIRAALLCERILLDRPDEIARLKETRPEIVPKARAPRQHPPGATFDQILRTTVTRDMSAEVIQALKREEEKRIRRLAREHGMTPADFLRATPEALSQQALERDRKAWRKWKEGGPLPSPFARNIGRGASD